MGSSQLVYFTPMAVDQQDMSTMSFQYVWKINILIQKMNVKVSIIAFLILGGVLCAQNCSKTTDEDPSQCEECAQGFYVEEGSCFLCEDGNVSRPGCPETQEQVSEENDYAAANTMTVDLLGMNVDNNAGETIMVEAESSGVAATGQGSGDAAIAINNQPLNPSQPQTFEQILSSQSVANTQPIQSEPLTQAAPPGGFSFAPLSPSPPTMDLATLLVSLLPPNCDQFTVLPFLQCTSCQEGYQITSSRICQAFTYGPSPVTVAPFEPATTVHPPPTVTETVTADPLTETLTEPPTSLSQQPPQTYESTLQFSSTEGFITQPSFGMPRKYIINDMNCVTKNLLFDFDLPISESNTRCSSCFFGYYYDLKQEKCKPVNPLCRTHEQNKCVSCFRGYHLDQGDCILGDMVSPVTIVARSSQSSPLQNSGWKDPNCRKFFEGTDQCQQCYYHHYRHPDTNRCTQVHPSCATWDPQTGYCRSCYSGYTSGLTDRQCHPKSTTLFIMQSSQRDQQDKCFHKINGECKACIFRYYLENGKCLKVSDDCHTFDPLNGHCLTCYPGYSLIDGRCEAPLASPDPFCTIFTESGCQLCIINYYVDLQDNRKCKGVSPLCLGYNPVGGYCQGCLFPFTLHLGKCVYLPS